MAFLKRLLHVIGLCAVLGLLLAAIPFMVSAERQVRSASQMSVGRAAPLKPQPTVAASANEATARPVAPPQPRASHAPAPSALTADVSRSSSRSPEVRPAVAVAATGSASAVLSSPARPVSVRPAASPQSAAAKRAHSAESVPMRRGKWIEVILAEQRLVAWEDGRMMMTTPVSTGTSDTPTIRGVFRIYRKFPSQRMRGRGYDLPDVPYVMYFKGSYAMHGTYWHDNFGRPMSHGCVNLPIGKAAWLYEWAPRGTLVVIH